MFVCRRGYEDRYDPYRPPAPPEDRGLFKPAETIDYGHKPSSSGIGLIVYEGFIFVLCM